MHIPRKNPRQIITFVAILFALIILALLSYGLFAKKNSSWPFKSDETNSTQGSTSTNSKTDADFDSSIPRDTTDPKTPSANEDESQNQNLPTNSSNSSASKNTPMTITYIQQMDNSIKIGTNLELITNSGNCTLSVRDSDGSEVYTEVVGVQALASSSTCKGFSVQSSRVGAGTYTYSVSFMKKGVTGTASKDYKKSR